MPQVKSTKSHWGCTAVLTPILVLLYMCIAVSTFAAGPLPPECNGISKAYVLIGDDSGFLTEGYAQSSANEAGSDFEDAGYSVTRNNSATKQTAENALNDPCIRAIWIFGHGKYNTKDGVLGLEKLADPAEVIDMAGSTIIRGPGEGANIPSNDCLNQVTLHSCGQNLQGWMDHFPGAEFSAWSSTVRGYTIFWWQYFHQYPKIDESGQELQLERSLSPPPVVEARQEHSGQHIFEPHVNLFRADGDPQSNCWMLDSQLEADFGSQEFNLIVVDEHGVREDLILVGARSINGRIIQWSQESLTPGFNVEMTSRALQNVLADSSAYPAEVTSGGVTLVRITSTEPEGVLLDGFGGLVFGWSSALCADIDFDFLSDNETVDVQFPAALFASAVGFENKTVAQDRGSSLPNYVCTAPVGYNATCDQPTIVDFVNPVYDLTFLGVGIDDTGAVARVNIFEDHVFSGSVDIFGQGEATEPVTIDLVDFSGITRIEIVDISDSAGVGWDDFTFGITVAIFQDGFESGDTSAWSETLP